MCTRGLEGGLQARRYMGGLAASRAKAARYTPGLCCCDENAAPAPVAEMADIMESPTRGVLPLTEPGPPSLGRDELDASMPVSRLE